MSVRTSTLAVSLLLALVAPPCFAQRIDATAAAKSEASFNAAEDALWRQHRLLQIQKQVEDARKASEPDLPDDALLARLGGATALPAGAVAVQSAPAPPPGPPAEPAMPFRLASIWGIEGKYQVFIQTGQMRQLVALGAPLPGGWTLVGVEAGSIRVRKGNVVKTMALGS